MHSHQVRLTGSVSTILKIKGGLSGALLTIQSQLPHMCITIATNQPLTTTWTVYPFISHLLVSHNTATLPILSTVFFSQCHCSTDIQKPYVPTALHAAALVIIIHRAIFRTTHNYHLMYQMQSTRYGICVNRR